MLKNGEIVAQGTQKELLKGCSLYTDMWKAHIGAKAWAVSQKKEDTTNV